MILSQSLSFNIFFNVPSDKVASHGFGHRRYKCTSASTDHILFLYWRMRKWTTFLHWLIKIENSLKKSMFQK